MRVVPWLAVILSWAVPASAQRSFVDASARAVASTAELLPDAVATALDDCTAHPEGPARRNCAAHRRRRAASSLRATYLVELPGEGHLAFGPYEPGGGGFRVRVLPFALRRQVGPGVLATAPTQFGVLPTAPAAAEAFVPVEAYDADAYLALHPPQTLRVRLLVRLGEDFEDPSAPEPAARYGVRLQVLGVQLVEDGTELVLSDTFAARPPPAPRRLDDRVRLWSHVDRAEALFTSPEGADVVLSVRLEPRNPGDTSQTAVLMQTFGATAIEITRVTAPCCSSSIDVRRHGATSILGIVTEQSSEAGSAGRGRVLLLGWDPNTRLFEPRAEWAGSNHETPPAWVVDPAIDP